MKNIKLLFVSLLVVFSFNAFGMEQDVQLKGKEEKAITTTESSQNSKVRSLKDLSAEVFVKAAKEDYTLEQLLEKLEGHPEEFKDLVVQLWMKDSPVYELLRRYSPFAESKILITGHDDLIRAHGFVTSLELSPDGRQVAIAHGYKAVDIWDVATEECLHELSGHHSKCVNSVAWSPDGRQIATGSEDKTVRIWDVTTGECLQTLEHDSPVRSVAWSPGGKQVATISGKYHDETAKMWDVTTGECLKTCGGNSLIRSVAWGPDHKQVALGSLFGEVQIYDVGTRERLQKLKKNNSEVESVEWSPDGKQIATGSEDTKVRIWDVATGKCLQQTHGRIASWSPDGKHLALQCDSVVKLMTLNGEKITVRTLGSHSSVRFISIYSIVWSPDGKQIATGSYDKTAKIWDVATGDCLQTIKHNNPVHSIAWSPDGNLVVTASSECAKNEGDVKIWTKDESAIDELKQINTHGKALALEKVYEILTGAQETENRVADSGVLNFIKKKVSGIFQSSFQKKKVAIASLKQQENVDTETIDNVLTILENE